MENRFVFSSSKLTLRGFVRAELVIKRDGREDEHRPVEIRGDALVVNFGDGDAPSTGHFVLYANDGTPYHAGAMEIGEPIP